MGILDRIGEDTLTRLERASRRRIEEADCLADRRYFLAAIYLCGYAVEISLGMAYFKARKFGKNDPITDDVRKRAVFQAQARGLMVRGKSHDIEGWARTLVADSDELYHTLDPRGARQILDDAALIAARWSPKLRYRDLNVNDSDYRDVRKAADRIIRTLS